jgi:hypothetical protein
MINLFLINEDEKNKILNLHKDATKRQYLKEQASTYGSGGWISVDLDKRTLTLNNYLLTQNDKKSLRINKDTVFRKETNNALITTQKVNYLLSNKSDSGFIRYFCNNKNFAVLPYVTERFYGERFQQNVQKGFDDLCNKIKTDEIDLGDPNRAKFNSESLFKNNYPCVVNHPNAEKLQKPTTRTETPTNTPVLNMETVYLINGNYYYRNGFKYITKDKKYVKYTCNDPEFKTSKSSTNKVYTPRPSDDVLDNYLNS